MGGSWFPATQWLVTDVALIISFVLICLNWRLPIVRNLALINFLLGLVGSQLFSQISQLPLHEAKYFWYLGLASINWGKVLCILLLIGWSMEYLCRTAVYLLTIFFLLGAASIARFLDVFVFSGGGVLSSFSTYYSVILPALNGLAYIVLIIPFVQSLFAKNRKKNTEETGKNPFEEESY